MDLPHNAFKARLATDDVQFGLWISLADHYAAEISASAGFDWVTIDAEHSPNDLRSIAAHLQAAWGYDVSTLVRPPVGDPVLIKQYLDLGAQTIIIPMVESAEQADLMVRATRYPPEGIRGVATGRASRWGRIADYGTRANDEMCVIVQVETVAGIDALDEILTVPDLDGVFIGPSDLGAALGHIGEPRHPDVRAAVADALKKIRAAGKAAGALSTIPELAREFADAGANFVAVGVDTSLLAKATNALVEEFITNPVAT